MSALADPVAGRAFFRRSAYFVCALPPPHDSGDPRRAALMAFAIDAGPQGDAFGQALELARNAGGRYYAIVVEALGLGTDAWPPHEPPHLARYVVERAGFVVLAPSILGRVSMPPERPHHLVQLVAAVPQGDEVAARAALAQLGTCGLVGRVRAVVHGDSGAELDAVVYGPDGIEGGYFAEPRGGAADAVAVDEVQVRPAVVAAPRDEEASIARAISDWTRGVDRAALLNEALAACAMTLPVRARLDALLSNRVPEADATEIHALIAAAVATATDYLWNEEPRVTWSDAFEERFRNHLEARHAWLSPRGLSALLAYARWLCWHEGLTG